MSTPPAKPPEILDQIVDVAFGTQAKAEGEICEKTEEIPVKSKRRLS